MFGGPSEVIPKKAMAAAELAANGSESGLIISFAGDAKYQIVCNTHEMSQPNLKFPGSRPGGERRSREPSRLDATGTPSVSYNTAKIVIIARSAHAFVSYVKKCARNTRTRTHTCAHPGGHDHDGER